MVGRSPEVNSSGQSAGAGSGEKSRLKGIRTTHIRPVGQVRFLITALHRCVRSQGFTPAPVRNGIAGFSLGNDSRKNFKIFLKTGLENTLRDLIFRTDWQ